MKNRERFWFPAAVIVISVIGMAFRWTGISFEGVDYTTCLLPWYEELKEIGSLHGLAVYNGSYNIPYVTLLYFLTWIPVKPIISIKMLSITFDYLLALLVMLIARDVLDEENKEI